MKSIVSTLTVIVLFVLTNCGSSSDPTPKLTEEEMQINRLAKTWIPGTVMYADDEITDEFDDFKLTITKNKTYSIAGSMGGFDYEPFKASGTWNFKDGDLNLIERNDGVEMTVQVTDNTLVLTFTTTEENGRVSGLGTYQFGLIAQ